MAIASGVSWFIRFIRAVPVLRMSLEKLTAELHEISHVYALCNSAMTGVLCGGFSPHLEHYLASITFQICLGGAYG